MKLSRIQLQLIMAYESVVIVLCLYYTLYMYIGPVCLCFIMSAPCVVHNKQVFCIIV